MLAVLYRTLTTPYLNYTYNTPKQKEAISMLRHAVQ
jgi:hypothetical protein